MQDCSISIANALAIQKSRTEPLVWSTKLVRIAFKAWETLNKTRPTFQWALCLLKAQHRPEPSWWRHQMETFSALLAICAGNSPVPGEFPTQRPVTLSFDVYFDLRPNKRLSKQSWGWWFETPWRPFWRHRNVHDYVLIVVFDKI